MVAAQIFCPHCGNPVSVSAACGVTRLREAIRLQSERFGVEAVCSHCKEGFLFSRLRRTTTETPREELRSIHGDK